jgi:hypothetical protein
MRTREFFLSLTCFGLMAATAVGQTQEIQNALQKQHDQARANQTAKPTFEGLEATIADALKYNPRVLAEQRKIRNAEAELNAIRNAVMVEVAAAYEVVNKSKQVLASAEKIHKLKQELRAQGQFSELEVVQAEIEVRRAADAVALCEAELMKLVGRVPGLAVPGADASKGASSPTEQGLKDQVISPNLRWTLDFTGNNSSGTQFVPQAIVPFMNPGSSSVPAGNMADKLRAVLGQPVRVEKEFKDVPARQVLEFLRDQGMKGIPMRMTSSNLLMTQIDLMPGELPLSAWLVAIQDSVTDLRFVVREYGLLVTFTDRVPSDGLLLGDFLRRINVPAPKNADSKKEDKPAEAQPAKPK